MAWLTGWSYRKEITVQDTNIDGNETDFPVYVPLIADVDIGDEARADGYDIRFTQSDGETLLKYERESWAGGAGTDATAVFWVKSNLASTGGATIYLYYGKADATDGQDPTNVWDSDFVGVWHLKETSGAHLDSTSYNNDSTTVAVTTQGSASGKINGTSEWVTNDDYIIVDDADELDGMAALTVSFWVYFAGDNVNYPGFIDKGLTAGWGLYMKTTTPGQNELGGGILTTGSGGGSSEWYVGNFGKDLPDDIWAHLCFTWSATEAQANWYLNSSVGTGQARDGDNVAANSTALTLGNRGTTNGITGFYDEFRVSKTRRSAAWIKFEHRNANEADNELTWGSEEAGGGGAYSLTLDSATITVTGSAMTPLVDRTLGLGAGSYIITGIAIDPLTERALGLDAGEFLLTGTAINMLCEKILDLGTGTYILTGSEIDVLRDAILGLEVGAYIIVGKDVITVYSGGGAVLATMFFIHNF